ncbi:gliding motility-associated C-terminal domain-containing protein [Tenacibaculum salmonis]|uniref:gliding motility-associated C-terminal domain-containing protein n=1 Tax=Tenacibaculum sp. P3-BQ1 TaxID=3232310 RepID=UPI0034E001F3
MKLFTYLMVLIIPLSITAQTAFYNHGNIQIHDEASIAFHTNLINDGNFDDNNKGLVTFYSDTEILTVSGNNKAIFFDVDIDTANDLELQTSLGITNDLSFINGKILTQRDNLNTSLDFINHNIYAGEDNLRHVDGYTSINGLNEFTFPIGDNNQLRPMILPTQSTKSTFLGAYFSEDPNTPSTFGQSFLTDQKQVFIENISKKEFWDLNGTNATSITLTWNAQSDIPLITDAIDRLKVVGWSITENKWIDLGNANVIGDLNSGRITSNTFIPDNFEIITIASGFSDNNSVDTNILFSPNGDNINDTLIFENLESYDNNNLEIFNRWGNVVYKTENYKNNWSGESTGRFTLNTKDKLPTGTYFYIFNYVKNGTSKVQKGWVYINL